MNTNIYVLSDGHKFYIGKADNVERRYWQHVRDAFNTSRSRYNDDISVWIREYGSKEIAIQYIQIYKVKEVPYKDWERIETKGIAAYRDYYGRDRVMNMTDGGDCGPILKGEDSGTSKLTWEDVEYIRELEYPTAYYAEYFEVSNNTVLKVIWNDSWYDPEYTPPPKMEYGSLTQESIDYIRNSDEDREQLAEIFGVSYSLICKVLTNEVWYDPEYKPSSPHKIHDFSGENHWNNQLTWEDIEYIRSSGLPSQELADYFSISRTHIYRILRNQSWYDPDYEP